jgi:hypothetical protein
VNRPAVINVRVSREEREQLHQLAAREERTPSDVMRRLLRQATQPAAQKEPADAAQHT